MRAIVLDGPTLEVRNVPEPVAGPGQVLIAPAFTGLCGSDIHLRQALARTEPGQKPFTAAFIPGHEFAGRVVAVGDGVEAISVGDMVTAMPQAMGASGIETIGVSPVRGGALAELCATDVERTFVLPQGLDLQLGALTEPLAVSVHILDLAATSGPVIVFGAGSIGLCVFALAAGSGRPVLVVEPAPARRAMAERLGATHVTAPGPDIAELVARIGFNAALPAPFLAGEPYRLSIIEATGRTDVVRAVIERAPLHSIVVLAGMAGADVTFNPLQPSLNELTVRFSHAYRPAHFVEAIEELARRPETYRSLITSVRPLEETGDALDALAGSPEQVKILIAPNG